MAEHENPCERGLGQRQLAAGLLAVIVLLIWVWADFRVSIDSPLRLREPAIFQINKGSGISVVARDLKTNGILVEPLWFKVLAYSRAAGMKYGEYEIPPGMTVRGLLYMLVAGRTRQYPLTIVEGWTFAQMREALARQPGLVQETTIQSPDDIMGRLGAPGQPPEGRFFPDTYQMDSRTSDLDILKRAYNRMQTVLEDEWRGRAPNLPFHTPYEALILASIVEKETGRAEERPEIAGVFVRRLRQGMRLQTDPTVIYGMGYGFDGNIRRDDLRRDTPFNTYTRAGLPPTPIALPGREAIHAALHPAEGTSLYFVARGDGGHVFSTTLAEHERAVNQFQKH